MRPKFKRTRLLVNPAFQFSLMARMGFYLLLYTVAVLHISFVFEVMMYIMNIPANGVGKGIDDLYLEFLLQQKPFLFTLVLIAPILLYDLLKFSNRVAGPLYRCRNVMQDMAAGKQVAEFKPRKHDLMREFFETFNTLIREWNIRVGTNVNGHQGDASPAGSGTEEVSRI